MVVPVLITSCQTSEKPKIGPVTAQTITAPSARMKASGRPVKAAILPAIAVKSRSIARAPPARLAGRRRAAAVPERRGPRRG